MERCAGERDEPSADARLPTRQPEHRRDLHSKHTLAAQAHAESRVVMEIETAAARSRAIAARRSMSRVTRWF